jgi:hypothetical protein
VAVTGVLAGITTWSGLDTLSARDDLPPGATAPQIDEVRSRITRTDVLLGVTAGVGVLTLIAGTTLVEWDGGASSAGLEPRSGGGLLRVGRRF